MGDLAADPVRDQALRDAAGTVADIVIEFASDPKTYPNLMGTIARSGYAVTTIGLETERLQERTGVALPDKIQFDLVFTQMTGPELAAFGAAPLNRPPLPGSRASEAFIFLMVLPPGAQVLAQVSPRSLFRAIVQSLHGSPDVIVHEVTHMLDHFRGGEFFSRTAPPYLRPEDYPTPAEYALAYINNPVEFNAHFQQAMFEVRYVLEHATPIQRRKIMKSFDNFANVFVQTVSGNKLAAATRGKWARKLSSRLYQTWEYWTEQEE